MKISNRTAKLMLALLVDTVEAQAEDIADLTALVASMEKDRQARKPGATSRSKQTEETA